MYIIRSLMEYDRAIKISYLFNQKIKWKSFFKQMYFFDKKQIDDARCL
jgi:hypothetical protein